MSEEEAFWERYREMVMASVMERMSRKERTDPLSDEAATEFFGKEAKPYHYNCDSFMWGWQECRRRVQEHIDRVEAENDALLNRNEELTINRWRAFSEELLVELKHYFFATEGYIGKHGDLVSEIAAELEKRAK